ncbi:WhiB family transcriptional regulator [Mycolicibacterium nivoides]|uniref:WhiB family transcriptional regulator n=1 Tax=Mycolicibacterium nivoides TaxID=2487344 RepID=UPI003C2E85E2
MHPARPVAVRRCGFRGRPLRRREDAAKAICQACPVLARCRAHALSAPEPYGIWGAMTARERAVKLSDKG